VCVCWRRDLPATPCLGCMYPPPHMHPPPHMYVQRAEAIADVMQE